MEFFRGVVFREGVSQCGFLAEERLQCCVQRVTPLSLMENALRGSTHSAQLPATSGKRVRCSYVPRIA